ncbi:hypothetical protein [Daejeonella sp.]|uniref:hypothetical protein n=1 Tax=Daejeonella sp. TaxID=2805397 RepID=UPI0030C1EDEF
MSATDNKEIDAQLQLTAIELLKGSINLPSIPDQSFTDFVFNINLESRVDQMKMLVYIITDVEIKSADQTLTLGSLTSSCIFKILNFADIVTITKEGLVDLPQQLLDILNSISISTTRGLMFSTFKGTFLHNAFLPIIIPKKLSEQPPRDKP